MKHCVLLSVFVLTLAACSASRKVSHVDVREPAGVRASAQVSALREKLSQKTGAFPACPASLSEILPLLATERVKLPTCSDKLQTSLEAARAALSVEEISRVEELIEDQCRSSSELQSEGSLEDILRSAELGPASMRSSGQLYSEEQLQRRDALRDSLLEMKRQNEPITEWMRLHGGFVIPDEPLQFLDRIIERSNCRMKSEEVDLSYRTIRSLEDLARMEPEGDPQRLRIERLLSGIYQVIDQKIREFFTR